MSKRLSWKVTVGTSVVQLPTGTVNDSVIIKADTDNVGQIYIGNDGEDSVSASTGFEIQAGEYVMFSNVGSLGEIYAVASQADQHLYILLGKA